MVNYPVRCHFCLATLHRARARNRTPANAQAEATSTRIAFSRSLPRHARRPHDSQLHFQVGNDDERAVTRHIYALSLVARFSPFRALDDEEDKRMTPILMAHK